MYQHVLITDQAENVGMNTDQLYRAMQLLDEEVAAQNIPGAVALIARDGKVVMEYAVGLAEHSEQALRAMEVTSIFDLASLTKVMATVPAILMLMEQGLLELQHPISRYIPEFAIHGKSEITIEQLLTHTSGLAADQNMYSRGWSKSDILQHVWNQELEYEPGTKMVYSDLGFIALGEIVVRVSGLPLNKFVLERIYEPLGMVETCYLPTEPLLARVAATEYDEALGRHKRGEVHDENAYAMGGVSGHAGLFSSVRDVARYASLWLNGGTFGPVRLLSQTTIQAALRGYTNSIAGTNRGLGWVLHNDQWDVSGEIMSSASFSHTGFTGTSIVCDPQQRLLVILLTNRVHYGRSRSIATLRNSFHDAVAASIQLGSGFT